MEVEQTTPTCPRSEQLCFFKFPRPLLDRFGNEFFKSAPTQPGVYIFRGARNRVLYVGQSHNLKLRLAYYKNAQPEREPRKVIRLVHQTESIHWSTCASAEEAQLLEIELIRELRPRFNVALTLTPTYTFFGLELTEAEIRMRFSLRNEMRPKETWIGAFKNHGLCKKAFRALGRTLWAINRSVGSVYGFPIWLNEQSRRSDFEVAQVRDEQFFELLLQFFRGESSRFVGEIDPLIHGASESNLKQLFENDRLCLEEFFQLAERMKKVREYVGKTQIVEAEHVDGTLLKMRWEKGK